MQYVTVGGAILCLTSQRNDHAAIINHPGFDSAYEL